MPYRIDRNSDLVLLKNRKSNKNRLIYDENLFDDDDDDDDEDDDYLSEIIEIRPTKGRVRPKINENEKIRRMPRIVYHDEVDDDDDEQGPLSIMKNRRKHRSYERPTLYYEGKDGRHYTRPSKRTFIKDRPVQFDYVDDEPKKFLKKVIIDPRTGHRETFYNPDRRRKAEKLFVRQRPVEILVESDDDEPRVNYFSPAKATRVRDKFAHGGPSERFYVVDSKLPRVANGRQVFYEKPRRKLINEYRY